jgi:hypothetical protein
MANSFPARRGMSVRLFAKTGHWKIDAS